MERISVSLVIITYNEENNIERCIRSVPFASDIVVLDSGSTDQTVDIARRLGARVRVEPWRGFQKQKKRALALALHNWVISLDADEKLSSKAAAEIEALLVEGKLKTDGYKLPRINYHLGRWIRHGGWYPDYQVRFFDRTKCHWTETEIHEKVSGKSIGRLKGAILHWSYDSLATYVDTTNRYSELKVAQWSKTGKTFSLIKMATKPIVKFIEKFIVKSGWRDGMAGFIIAVVSSFETFLRFAKLWEAKHMKPQNPEKPE